MANANMENGKNYYEIFSTEIVRAENNIRFFKSIVSVFLPAVILYRMCLAECLLCAAYLVIRRVHARNCAAANCRVSRIVKFSTNICSHCLRVCFLVVAYFFAG